jgi:phosphoribosylamine-glycine ligase
LCDALKLSNPRAVAFDDRAAAIDYAQMAGMPLIVKPVDLTGGKGIGVIREMDDVEPMVDQAFSKSRQKVVVVEEFLDGTLHSCCSVVRNQQVIFDFFADELMLENPFLVASAMTPSVIDPVSRRIVKNEIEAIARHLQLVDGLVHVQFIQSKGRPRMIEVCRRPPGDLYLDFVRLSTGLDIAEVIVRFSLGEQSEVIGRENRPVLRQCVMADRIGKVDDVRFDDVLGPRVSNRIPLRTLPTTIEQYLTEKTEIFFAEFESVEEMRSVASRVRQHISITYS